MSNCASPPRNEPSPLLPSVPARSSWAGGRSRALVSSTSVSTVRSRSASTPDSALPTHAHALKTRGGATPYTGRNLAQSAPYKVNSTAPLIPP